MSVWQGLKKRESLDMTVDFLDAGFEQNEQRWQDEVRRKTVKYQASLIRVVRLKDE